MVSPRLESGAKPGGEEVHSRPPSGPAQRTDRGPLRGGGRVSEFVRLPARLIIEEVLEAKRETR
jgi:hypothetical protein